MAGRLGLGLTAAAAAAANDNRSDDDINNADDSNGRIGYDGSREGAGEAAAEEGGSGEREGRRLEGANVVITSYSVLRTDAAVLCEQVAV